MKFSDVVLATISLALVGLILDAFLMVAFSSTNSSSADLVAGVIAFLVTSLAVGYVFALKIQEESRIRAIGSVVVLFAFTLLMFLAVWFANPLAKNWLTDSMNNTFNTTGWTDYDWAAYSALWGSVDVIISAVVGFVGLYIGSMLRKPSAKT